MVKQKKRVNTLLTVLMSLLCLFWVYFHCADPC